MVAVGLGDDLVFTLGAAVAERIETQSSESPNAVRAKQQILLIADSAKNQIERSNNFLLSQLWKTLDLV